MFFIKKIPIHDFHVLLIYAHFWKGSTDFKCGIKKKKTKDSKIVGGTQTEVKQYTEKNRINITYLRNLYVF